MNRTESVNSGAKAELAVLTRTGKWCSRSALLGVIASAVVACLLLPRSAGTTATARIFNHHFVVAHGSATAFAFMVMFVIGIWVPGWAIVDAIRTPRSAFESRGRSKSRWVTSMVILLLIGDASLLLVPIYFLMRVRPQLISGREVTHL